MRTLEPRSRKPREPALSDAERSEEESKGGAPPFRWIGVQGLHAGDWAGRRSVYGREEFVGFV